MKSFHDSRRKTAPREGDYCLATWKSFEFRGNYNFMSFRFRFVINFNIKGLYWLKKCFNQPKNNKAPHLFWTRVVFNTNYWEKWSDNKLFSWHREGGKLRYTITFSGLPMIVETAVVTSEKTGLVSTPSKLRLVMMCRQGMFLLLISNGSIKMGRFSL